MKKKGFTLIELLAVIVVLAIIALIATPMVLNTIEDAKKGAAKSSTLMMVDAARLYHTRQYINPLNQFEGFECSISDGKGCDELSLKGQKPDKGIITISSKGEVNGKVVFGKYTYYICNDKVTEEETAGCSVTDYSLIYDITNEGIITGFKIKEETAFLNIIEEVNASELTDEAKEVIENKSLTIPEYVGDIEVNGIAANAFTSYEIEKVTILPSKRITIGENAFPENLVKLKVSECSSRHYSEYQDILETFESVCKFQEYTITYDLNDGTGDIPVQYKTEGVDTTITTSVPTKEGYNFIGWATTKDATSAEYESGATYTNDNDVTLYAVWKVKEYTIAYNLNGGTGDISSQIKTEGIDTTLTTTEPTKAGYKFIGWATTKDATSAEYESGATYSNDNDVTLYAVWKAYKCIRATELHSEKCSNTDSGYYCRNSGYSSGATIKYGNPTVTENKLTSGDPFTCDVDGNGEYNETTERFYYVTDLDTNSEYAVLIYYNNTLKGVANNTLSSWSYYYYDGYAGYSYYGPEHAKVNLPTTTQWTNVRLANTTRSIKNQNGGTTSNGRNLPQSYSYEGYAARLLTYPEVVAACGEGSPTTKNYLNNCNYLMENTKFTTSSDRATGYYLETASSSSYNNVYTVESSSRYLEATSAAAYQRISVRPAIEVLKTDIDY